MPPLSFVDPAGDVTQGGEPVSGDLADGTDIVSVTFTEGDDLTFTLGLADLDGLQSDALDDTLHAQYALSFDTPAHQFSMHAMFGGMTRVLGDLGWSFQVHDRDADTWTDVDGRVDGDDLVWTVAPTDISLADGDRLEDWSVSAWTSQDGEQQINDQAATGLAYELGTGVVGAVNGTSVLLDDAGDVTRGSDPYDGPGAGSVDVLAARAWLTDEGVQFELDLADLGSLAEEDGTPGFHAQYALSFHTEEDHAGWSMRATSRAGGDWDLQLHDKERDEWPDALGAVREDTITWRIPMEMLGVGRGDALWGWHVATWNSADDADQYGDWAEGAATVPLDEAVPAEPFFEDGVVVVDGVGDVASQGTPYDGPGAGSTDVLEGRIAHTLAGLRFELDLLDLSALAVEAGEPGFHAQYAFSFIVADGHDGWSVRASYSGTERAHGDPWRFQVHDQESDVWTDVAGQVDEDTLVWVLPLETFGLAQGDIMWGWDVSTWNSFDERGQYGDAASGAAVYTIGAPAEPAERGLDAVIPGVPLAWLALGLLALARRR